MSGSIADIGRSIAGTEYDLGGLPTETETESDMAATVRTFDAQNIPLTPQLILYICRKQLNQMDADIRRTMLDIDGTHRRSEELAHQIDALEELETALRDTDHVCSDGVVDVNKLNDRRTDCANLRVKLGLPGEREDGDMRDEFAALMERYGIEYSSSDSSFNLSTIQSKIEQLKNEQQTINSGNEMKMMWLQNAMQQRTQTLQAGSNFLASINDTLKTIVGNLR
jgi:hypothetical protein